MSVGNSGDSKHQQVLEEGEVFCRVHAAGVCMRLAISSEEAEQTPQPRHFLGSGGTAGELPSQPHPVSGITLTTAGRPAKGMGGLWIP